MEYWSDVFIFTQYSITPRLRHFNLSILGRIDAPVAFTYESDYNPDH